MNMNRAFTYILTLGLLMIGGGVMGQVTVKGNVFGGGNLAPVKGSSSVTIKQSGAVIGTLVNQTLQTGTGDVYGGGALADVNVTATGSGQNTTYIHTDNTTTKVELTDGTVLGDVYGGGLGDNDHSAKVYGPVTVNIGTGEVNTTTGEVTNVVGNVTIQGSIFGCNNEW
jgi:hypothetical protein